MRIIAGTAKGRQLKTPEGRETRPTLDRVKEAMFGSIQFDLPGAQVLDLFAGSGGLGLEAISRGAAHTMFVDTSRRAIAIIEENIRALGFAASCTVCQMEAQAALESFARRSLAFDIVFLDPPYASDAAEAAIAKLADAALIARGGKIITEHATTTTPQPPEGFVVCFSKRYGDVGVTILKRTEDDAK